MSSRLPRLLLVALVAVGAAIAAGAPASSVMPLALRDVGAHGPLAGFAPTLSKSAFMLLTVAMYALYVAAMRCSSRLPAGWIVAAIVFLNALFVVAPVMLSNDVSLYVAWARLGALHDLNPHVHGVADGPADLAAAQVSGKYLEWSSTYGPLFTLLTYGAVPFGPIGAVWALKSAMGAAALGCVALVASCARRLGRQPLFAAAFVGLNPIFLVFVVGGAHNDALLALLLAAALALWAAGRERGGPARSPPSRSRLRAPCCCRSCSPERGADARS